MDSVAQTDLDCEFERQLFDEYYEKVYRSAYFIIKDPHLAQDVTQEVFIKVFKHYHKVEQGEKLYPWIMTVTTTTAIDELRKKKRWNERTTADVLIDKPTFQLEDYSAVEKKVETKFMNESIYDCILHLDPKFKQILLLKYIGDYKDKEISNQLQISLGTVKSRLHRAKLKVKEILMQNRIVLEREGV